MDKKAQFYLDSYLQTLSPVDRHRYKNFEAYYFCLDEKNANICASLVLQGEKRATASLLWWYEVENEPLPEVGNLSVITNWEGVPQCIIETTSVEVKPFNEVSPEFAFEEGEGDKSLENWKKDHWKFFSLECEEIGREPSEEMPVILEKFKVIYTS
ncbi:MAG: ASCH domain-containing protein [Anaerolineales bacterium]|nr:MAG: ASCH domain-containing protein [Anaerolineales bacterium]